jgi:DNA mismatch endonuclease (patch repair protein)
LPTSRTDYWTPKIEANRDRDRRKRAELRVIGWRVLTVWQCELRKPERLESKLRSFFGLG